MGESERSSGDVGRQRILYADKDLIAKDRVLLAALVEPVKMTTLATDSEALA
jgi:hypothetical protein